MTELELPDAIHDGVKNLCATGDDAAKAGRFKEAISWYKRALDLLPAPATDWEAATWIYAAIGDAHCFLHDPPAALDAFDMALRSPNSLGNAFLHLRRGQALFDTGRKKEAADELARAYMLEDEVIFRGRRWQVSGVSKSSSAAAGEVTAEACSATG